MQSNEYQIDAKYRLTGVIEHFGSAHGGHYVGYRPLFPEQENCTKWVVCDDSRITIIDKESVLKRKAYMLMYSRI
jgi:ubiquitin C-terminal hydrolase